MFLFMNPNHAVSDVSFYVLFKSLKYTSNHPFGQFSLKIEVTETAITPPIISQEKQAIFVVYW